VCEPECPAEAILPDSDDRGTPWLERNLEYAKLWPNITRKGTPPDDADAWKDKPNKGELFSPDPGEA
jgi:ferredoxin